jgi:hypothetical protein
MAIRPKCPIQADTGNGLALSYVVGMIPSVYCRRQRSSNIPRNGNLYLLKQDVRGKNVEHKYHRTEYPLSNQIAVAVRGVRTPDPTVALPGILVVLHLENLSMSAACSFSI